MSKRGLDIAGYTLAAVSIAVAGAAYAQQESEPETQYKPPAQQIQKVQKEKKADDDTGKSKDSGQSPAGAVTPSDLKKHEAVSPSDLKQRKPEIRRRPAAAQGRRPVAGEPELVRAVPAGAAPGSTVRLQGRNLGPDRGDRGVYLLVDGRGYSMGIRGWSDGEIVAVVPPDAELGPAVIRIVPRGRDVVLTEIDFEVISPIADSDALPDDAGRHDVPGAGERGGFTPPAGGFTVACDGPDLAVAIELERVAENGDGSYDFTLMGRVRNAGREHWSSGDGQQAFVWRQGGRELDRLSWNGNLSPGQVAFRSARRIEGWRPGTEFTTGYEFSVDYDPDIGMDGNPNNDDCNSGNNKATLAPDEIARHVGAR